MERLVQERITPKNKPKSMHKPKRKRFSDRDAVVVCEICSTILSPNNITEHIKDYHEQISNTVVICEYCSTILRESNYANHMKSQHEEWAKPGQNPNHKKRKKGRLESWGWKERIDYLTKEQITLSALTLFIIWDDITFERDLVRFLPTRLNEFLFPVEVKGVFPELNIIKDEYFNRLWGKKIYKLKFFKNVLLIEDSPDWQSILESIELVKDLYQFRTTRKNTFGPHLSIESTSSFFNVFSNNDYLKYLATKQNISFKVIPIYEVRNNIKEESFIFRMITKKDNILILWENVISGRATHLFLCSKEQLESVLLNIESFICTSMQYKRSLLYLESQESEDIRKKLAYLTAFKHTDIEDYESYIAEIIDEY